MVQAQGCEKHQRQVGGLLCLSAADADVSRLEKHAECHVARGRTTASRGCPGSSGLLASEKAGLTSFLSLSVLSLV